MKMSRRAFSRCPYPGGIPKLHLPSPQGNSGKIKKYFFRKGAVLVTDRNFYFRPGDTLPPCPGFLFHIVLIYNFLLIYRGE